jgi:adenosylhomocysteine nucleosidase
MRVGIIAALKEEIDPLVQSMEDVETCKWGRHIIHQGKIGDCQVVAVSGGVGKIKAAACTQYLIDQFSMEALICTGVAGAVNPRLHTGDIVISRRAMQHDFDPGDPELLKKFRKRWLEADSGLVTGDQAIVSAEKRRWLWETFGADCVDMESAAVAQVCQMNGVPWVIVRAISDSAEEDSIAEFRSNLREAASLAASVAAGITKSIRTG